MSIKKNSDVFSEVIVGAFMVGVLALLVYFTIIISGVDLVFGHKKVDATVVFQDVGGLKERDSVVYRGMKVGTVDRIVLGASNITVTAVVSKDVVLRDRYRISVAALSLLGGNYLLLEEGTGNTLPLVGTVFQGETPTDWMRDLGDIAKNLNALTSHGGISGIVTNLQSVSENANIIVARLERGEGTIGKLLSTNDTVYTDLAATMASARTVSGRLENGEGSLGKLLSSNDTVYVDLQRTLANAAEISDRLAKGEGTVGRLLSTNDQVYADLQKSVANIREITARMNEGKGLLGRISADDQLADNAAQLLKNLEAVSAKLAKGEGSLGKLANDSEMYDEVNGLIKDVRQVVDNYRDTTPISTFGSLILGGL